MKFLFQNNIISINVTRLSVMFKVLFYHLICYIARAPYTVTYRPKMLAPITFRQIWIFLLQSSRCSTLQPFYNITNRLRRRIFNMDVDVIFTNYSIQDSNIFRITYLFYQFSTSFLYITLQNMVSIFRNPYNVGRQARYAVTPMSLTFAHLTKVLNCVATESLALKVHSFN